MRMISTLLTALTLMLLSFTSTTARAQSLKVGDPAPPLSNGKWVKGEPVKSFEAGKVYVIECWATWCGPCREAIPHVTELQHKYKDDVIIIGQNVWENDTAKVQPFLDKMGDKMDYRVVMDDVKDPSAPNNGQIAKTWLEAAGQNGIPCSFVVDKAGKIAWIGHPMEMEPVLKEVVAGKFDVKKAADNKSATQQLNADLGAAMQKQDFDGALKVMDAFQKDHPDWAERLAYTRFRINLEKKDYDAAYKAADVAIGAMKDNAQMLNQIAWTIVDDPKIEKRDLNIAMKAAQMGAEKTNFEEPQVLDTLARVHFEKGDVDKAIELQTKALGLAKTDKDQYQASLDRYKAAKK